MFHFSYEKNEEVCYFVITKLFMGVKGFTKFEVIQLGDEEKEDNAPEKPVPSTPDLDERIEELRKKGLGDGDIRVQLSHEGYNRREISKRKLAGQPAIEERIKELIAEGVDKEIQPLILEDEGYPPPALVAKYGGVYAKAKRDLKNGALVKSGDTYITGLAATKVLKTKGVSEEQVQNVILGPETRTPGYLDEFKTMIQREISRSRELTEVFYNIGLGTLLASLSKSGVSIEEFRKIALKQEGLREALEKAGETAFKALEYYRSDLITKVETERDDARAYVTVLETERDDLMKNLDPKFRLEKMIHTYLFSGNVDPNTLMALIDKWLSIELAEVKLEMLRS